MPLSSNPNKTTTCWLDVDADDPLATRPVFLVRYMTNAQVERHRELFDAAAAEPDNARALDLLLQAIDVGIVGWRNFFDEKGEPVPYSHEALLDGRLLERELWEIARTYPAFVRLAEDDRKNSGSPPASGGAAATTTAPPAAA